MAEVHKAEERKNRTRFRRRGSIEAGQDLARDAEAVGLDLHYEQWDPDSKVDTSWAKTFVGQNQGEWVQEKEGRKATVTTRVDQRKRAWQG